MNIPISRRIAFYLTLILINLSLFAQDRARATEIIEKLCSDYFAGRGYLENGDLKAANFISKEFEKLGLDKISDSYKLPFQLNVNTIPVAMVRIGGVDLRPGYDFLVAPESNSISGTYDIFYVSPKMLRSPKVAKKVKKAVKKGVLPVISVFDPKDKDLQKHIEEIKKCNKGAPFVFLKDHLTWSVARNQATKPEIWLLDSSFDSFAKSIEIEIQSNFITNYKSQNVFGFVPGTEHADSFIIFCGHYDHLGKMGDAIFYGANDNASGIAMLIDMAGYFVENPQKYSVAFVAFGGEEAGLVGSYNYVSNPAVPLKKTKFVFNMDLMGSGDNGATIVNGGVYKKRFDKLVEINTQNDYLPKINPRGKAANSDHYFFSEAGVPSFFIYLMGEYTHYHIPADNASNLKLSSYYDKSYLLIRDFIISLNEE